RGLLGVGAAARQDVGGAEGDRRVALDQALVGAGVPLAGTHHGLLVADDPLVHRGQYTARGGRVPRSRRYLRRRRRIARAPNAMPALPRPSTGTTSAQSTPPSVGAAGTARAGGGTTSG